MSSDEKDIIPVNWRPKKMVKTHSLPAKLKKYELDKNGQVPELSQADMEMIARMIEAGMTQSKICQVLGIVASTWWKLKKRYPDFFAVVELSMAEMDAAVTRSLYNTALGHVVTEKKAKVVGDGEGRSHLEMVEEEKYIPPNVAAQKLWLMNRMPDRWKEKQELHIGKLQQMSDDDLEKLIVKTLQEKGSIPEDLEDIETTDYNEVKDDNDEL